MALVRDGDVPENVWDLLWEFWNLPDIKKSIKDVKAWEELAKHIHQFKVVDKEILFFKESFTDWLEHFEGKYD